MPALLVAYGEALASGASRAVGSARHRIASALVLGLICGGCAGEGPEYDPEDGVVQQGVSGPAACESPAEGCPCEKDGTTASCGEAVLHEGLYVSCWPSHRVCKSGVWGACESEK